MSDSVEQKDIINEINIKGNELKEVDITYNILKSTVYIEYKNATASGFFIKFCKNNKPFYCLMTNEHVVDKPMLLNKEEIKIKFDNKQKELTLKLDKRERLMKTFEYLKIDATIIEILEKDNVSDDYYLLPSLDYKNENGYNYFKGKEIEVTQFPGGKVLSISIGRIKDVDLEDGQYIFSHLASTKYGSSGSPIVLKEDGHVIGIHKGGSKSKDLNYGHFIGPINDIIHNLKKNGEGIEYYKNGKIKYEGNFVDDLYEGDGKYYYENGDIYIGQFKKGKRNGDGCMIYNSENGHMVQGKFSDDELVIEENPDNNNEIENNDNNSNNNKNDSDNNNDSDNSSDNRKINSDNNNDSDNDDNHGSENNEYKNNEDENKSNDENNNNNEVEKKNNDDHNNNNNNDNNNKNNDNNNFNINNLIDINTLQTNIKTNFYHTFHGVGNLLGVKCLGCGHLVKKHEKIDFGKWKCLQCNEDDNICTTLK